MSNYPPPEPPPPGGMNTPPSPAQRGWPAWIIYTASTLAGFYLLNPGAGIFDLIPDNLPLIGNLDEAGAMMLVWWGIQEYLKRRKQP